MTVRVEHGDMRDVLARLIADKVPVHAIVTDAPYHLTSIVKRFGSETAAPAKVGKTGAYARASAGFMGQRWDGGDIAFQSGTWRLCFDLLPPGGHLLAFSSTRTYHRMALAIEEAGFEIRDMVSWIYGSGFPKSRNVSKAIDSEAGAVREVVAEYSDNGRKVPKHQNTHGAWEGDAMVKVTAPATDAARQWEGWGTALKPALEPICLARKPLVGTVAANVLKHGTGALNIDGCRVAHGGDVDLSAVQRQAVHTDNGFTLGKSKIGKDVPMYKPSGRWPANVVHDGSDEVVSAFPETQSGGGNGVRSESQNLCMSGKNYARITTDGQLPNEGSAARFFYSAKADAGDRLGSKHPTIKPVDLMRWLVRLITPPGGTVLDPFAGSGTTGMACMAEGIDCILVEREAEYVADIKARLAHVRGEDTPLFKAAE